MNIAQTDLMLNDDGSVYHLNLHPGELATTIILVGDPARVELVSQHFDRIDVRKHKREFVTHTGNLGAQKLSVIGTGIGVGNIEIVMTEVDALFNVNFSTRTIKEKLTSLRFVRIGTAGALQPNIPVDSYVISAYAIAFDGLLHYYQPQYTADEIQLMQAVDQHFAEFSMLTNAYVASAAHELCALFDHGCRQGITLTASGFYGSQHRHIRAPLSAKNIMASAQRFNYKGLAIANFEMETAGILALSKLLGHQSCSFNVIVANRHTDQVSHDPATVMRHAITLVLERLAEQQRITLTKRVMSSDFMD